MQAWVPQSYGWTVTRICAWYVKCSIIMNAFTLTFVRNKEIAFLCLVACEVFLANTRTLGWLLSNVRVKDDSKFANEVVVSRGQVEFSSIRALSWTYCKLLCWQEYPQPPHVTTKRYEYLGRPSGRNLCDWVVFPVRSISNGISANGSVCKISMARLSTTLEVWLQEIKSWKDYNQSSPRTTLQLNNISRSSHISNDIECN